MPSNFYKGYEGKTTNSQRPCRTFADDARVLQTRNGQALVTNTGNHRNHWRGDRFRSGSSVFWNVGIGLPFYGGYYGGYSYYGGYPYYRSSYYGGYSCGSFGYSYPYGYPANYCDLNYS